MRDGFVRRAGAIALIVLFCCTLSFVVWHLVTVNRVKDAPNSRTALSAEKAREIVSSFARDAKLQRIPGVSVLGLPSVPGDVLRSFEVLRKAGDNSYLADIAFVLMRYARENEEIGNISTPLYLDHPLVNEFVTIYNPKPLGDDPVSCYLADWICKNRSRLGACKELDEEIEKYQEFLRKRDKRDEEIIKEIERREESPGGK